MCVVKVNRVESNVLGISSKDSSQDSSPTSFPSPSSSAPESDAPPDGQTVYGSGVAGGAPERLAQWQIYPGHDESEGRLSVAQERPLLELPLEEDKTACCDSAEHKTHPRPLDGDPQTLSSSYEEAEAEGSRTRTHNADGSMDTTTELDSGSELNCVGLGASSPETLYRIKPAGGDSCTRCHSPPLSEGGRSREAGGAEESLPPPLLQRNAVDMPLLTPEREDKAGSCPLPPVLTQEMPSLTPAHEGASDVSGATSSSCGEPAAPVLQRETPTGSSSSSSSLGKGANDSAAREATALTQEMSRNVASDGVCEMENTELQNAASERSQSAQSVEFASNDCDGPALSDSACPHLSTGTSNGGVSPPAPPSASSTSHCTVHCPGRTPFAEPRPLPSSVWKNLSSVSSAVLTQSLNPPELHPDFTHDSLPYAMWAEPRCKEVTDLEGSDMVPRHMGCLAGEDGEEGGGTLTWAQLEPTSLISVGAAEPPGVCEDYEPQMGVGGGCEGASLSQQEIRHLDTATDLPLVMGGEEQDVASGMEEVEGRRQLGTRGDNSSESSDDEEEEEEDDEDEENNAGSYRCYESRLEPGEICAVSPCLCCQN